MIRTEAAAKKIADVGPATIPKAPLLCAAIAAELVAVISDVVENRESVDVLIVVELRDHVS